jgi:predicted  nucleic acid-binding Zn-ribbon protein
MSVAQQGINTLQNLAGQFKSLMDLNDALQSVGSLENLTSEMQAQKDKATADRDAVLADLVTQQAQLVAVKDQTAKLMADADAYVAESQIKADAAAFDIIQGAHNNADGINANAQTAAQKLIGDAGSQVTALQEEAAALQPQVDAANAQLAQINADIATANAKLASIKDSIAKIAAA